MTGYRHIIIDSIVGSPLAEAVFSAVEGLMPSGPEAKIGNSLSKGYNQRCVLMGNGYGF